jgi:hypothetical protein
MQHELDVLDRSITVQPAGAHGANMGAAGTNGARKLRVDENCATALV